MFKAFFSNCWDIHNLCDSGRPIIKCCSVVNKVKKNRNTLVTSFTFDNTLNYLIYDSFFYIRFKTILFCFFCFVFLGRESVASSSIHSSPRAGIGSFLSIEENEPSGLEEKLGDGADSRSDTSVMVSSLPQDGSPSHSLTSAFSTPRKNKSGVRFCRKIGKFKCYDRLKYFIRINAYYISWKINNFEGVSCSHSKIWYSTSEVYSFGTPTFVDRR